MSDQMPPPGDVDPGEPIPELAALAEVPGSGFLDRVRSSIQRRVATVHFVDFLLTMGLRFMGQIGTMIFGFFEGPESRGGGENQ